MSDISAQIKRALITGITGSGGSYLAEYIVPQSSRRRVHGLSRWHSTTASETCGNIREKSDRS